MGSACKKFGAHLGIGITSYPDYWAREQRG